jgi:chromosome partitioning protein
MIRRVIFNKKGGVGKTTITCNLAAISAESGRKTLVVDLDPQGNTSHYLMNGQIKDSRENCKTIYDYFKATIEPVNPFMFNPFFSHSAGTDNNIQEFIHKTEFRNLWIIPSHPDLSNIEHQLASKHKIFKLRDALDALNDFDAVFIDTPPALNFFSQSALIAASKCLIPFDCDAFSRDAVYEVGAHIGDIQNDHNHDLRVEGIVVNQFVPRTKQSREIVDALKAEGLPILSSHLSPSVKIKESHQLAKPMIYLDPKHKLTLEYVALYREIESIVEGR